MQPDYNHGLYNAIRKYGPHAFTLEVADTASSKQEAQRLEKKHIAAADKRFLYNISPGGEADGEFGGKLFWAAINENPDAKAAYLRKLSDVKTSDDWSDYGAMAAAAAQWRKQNPKEAYRLARRGTRIANRGIRPKSEDARSLKERLMWKHKRGDMVSKSTTAYWQSIDDTTRAAISEKASAASKAQWGAITDPAERAKLTEKARSSIDRIKQGKAASEGIKRWWAELKADPVRYASYINQRKRTLKKTLKDKK